jgi:hypothetical protein
VGLFFLPLFTQVRRKEEFSEVRGSKPTPNRYGLAHRDGAMAENRYDRNGPGHIRCKELLRALTGCYVPTS